MTWIILAVTLIYAGTVVYLCEAHRREIEKLWKALCAKNEVVIDRPEIKSPETAYQRRMREWREPPEDK